MPDNTYRPKDQSEVNVSYTADELKALQYKRAGEYLSALPVPERTPAQVRVICQASGLHHFVDNECWCGAKLGEPHV